MLSKEEIENKDELLRKISKEKYGDEWYIEKALLTYERQQEKTYTFFRDDEQEDLLRKYNWCQRPCDSNMSLKRFVVNGEIEGFMSESLAEEHNLVQVDLNEFIHKFIKVIIKEKIQLESREQKLIEKLEKDIEKATEIINDQEYKYIDEIIDEQWERRKYALEILKIVKGENNE